ncbi:Aspartate/glutamate/uridylate kinase [Irpex rosettiformis]|uniref:Aspartate/glutamate/uridylate kinase n=1 Tax=Irpex rosettiformis TaxID=378272 RepID=A0ACB8UHT8_9APHY|nr:Aspartate/glutamate/uridylate kinase [Irpex rosettiformis]
MARARHGPSSTIVIKLGTSSIVHETTHQPLLSTLSGLVETVTHLRALGHKVVLVSSGAIGVGLKRMEMASKPKSLSGKQALAAIGQGRLIALWDNLFGQLGQPIAQVLLTRGDISDRTRYLNAVNTFKELLSLGVVPIVNENDTVSVSEIKFGDNDTLSAITSSMIHADYLFLLTDVDSLYTSNPRKDPNAKSIDVVSSVSAIRSQVSTNTLGSSLGTGGMETKLIAADIATAAGVTTVITSSKDPGNILRIIEYNNAFRSGSTTPLHPSSGRSSPSLQNICAIDGISAPLLPTPRPPHTLFKPSPTPLRDLKSWTSHTLSPAGSVVIDSGAHQVLSRRESGGRLLAAGVLGVRGAFASGQAVRILVRRSQTSEKPETAAEAARARETYLDGGETEPTTPSSPPSESTTSSISTIDGMLDTSIAAFGDSDVTPSAHLRTLPEENHVLLGRKDESVDWEVEEVGRGLANYNSAQIERVKGLKSSNIVHVLGYADSEYVVENIMIRIPP